nr:CHAD domain-containing protein [Motilibacter aurantiacus]
MASAPSDVPELPPVGPKDSAATLVRAYIAGQARKLRESDLGVRRDEEDSIHQMRVAARRLRSGLKVFRPLLDREWADALREELKWLAGELSAARDREVLRERLDEAVKHLPEHVEPLAARSLIDRHLGKEADDGREQALTAMRSERYVALHDALVDAVNALPTTEAAAQPCSRALPPLVAKAWKRLDRDVKGLRLDGHDDEWHEARKAAKQARYACEAVAPALGKPAKQLAKQIERVTEHLGEHMDASIAAQTLQGFAAGAHVGGRTGFALGLLYCDERAAVDLARHQFLELWPEVADPKHRRWLRPG